MHSGSGRVLAVKQKSAVSVYVGIVALVLEGRALSGEEDEENLLRSQSPHFHHHREEVENAAPPVAATTNATRGGSSGGGIGVINRISEKLMRLRQFPGTSRELDVVESIAIPVHDEYERQPRLHHVASAREFQRNNPRMTSIPSSTSNSSAAASVLHDIDVDWNDISILFNGLDSIINVPSSFPIKAHHAFHHHRSLSHSLTISQDSARLKLIGNKTQARLLTDNNSKTACGSPSFVATSKPKQGPHCEKFLKKLGLLKLDSPELDIDHMCNHVNNYCRRWQFHLKKLLQVLSKAEDACIEVYLGPENNAILLEQWIITLTDKPSSTTTMTIQALCSAIRSQLYFSQISSWIDLLKKGGDFTPEIMQNPRLRKNLQTMQVDLDILFRVKPYDGSTCFNEKPIVHNFPDTIISDSLAICVCLKSLPRLEKIPTLNTEKAHLNGFSFVSDNNRMKPPSSISDAPMATSSSRLLLHDRMACHEKGKHRCKEEVEEEEEDDDEELRCIDTTTSIPTLSSVSSSSDASPLTSAELSHRERQLLKYKKRLMKRDKQKKKQLDCESNSHPSTSANQSTENTKIVVENINSMEIPLYQHPPPPLSSDEQLNKEKFCDDGNNSTAINNQINSNNVDEVDNIKQQQKQQENVLITSTNTNAVAATKTTTTSLSSSIATQTEFSDAIQKCDSCGNQLQLQCSNCDKIKTLTTTTTNNNNNNNQVASPLAIVISPITLSQTATSSVSTVCGTMVGNKANLLLQAIQRTAIANMHHHDHTDDVLSDNNNIFSSSKIQQQQPTPRDILSSSSTASAAAISIDTMSDDCDNILNNNNNNNNDNSLEISKESTVDDCRLCKRQKTKHNYSPSISIISASSSDSNCYRRTMSECMVGLGSEKEVDDSKIFLSPLSIHNCDDIATNGVSGNMLDEMLSYGELKAYRRAFSEDVINQLNDDDDDDEVITIKCHHEPSSSESSQVHKLTPNVSLLNSNRDTTTTLISGSYQQRIPKINLTQIFDTIQPHQSNLLQTVHSQSQNVINDSGLGNDLDFSPTSDNVFVFNSPVKSYPPSTMQLSPGSVMKRRTRHISDRSSISEYFSDEDDEVLAKCTSIAMQHTSKISSLYKKFVSKTQTAFNKFAKLPLLANIEENLLHNRFQPKAVVDGFKLLLGASGSFCPTQLTIPAQTYFYEFQGMKHMSTPYVCDFRMTRKYSIPRSGTVQATLLNPQGTVVRMFFVQYDFRDMPAMSQTFVRQRVLAIDEHISQKNVEQMSTSEQMKHLRYVINLRFQTGRSGRLCLHTDIKLIISRRTEFDTAAAHAKNSLESPNDLKTVIICPDNPKFSSRIERN